MCLNSVSCRRWRAHGRSFRRVDDAGFMPSGISSFGILARRDNCVWNGEQEHGRAGSAMFVLNKTNRCLPGSFGSEHRSSFRVRCAVQFMWYTVKPPTPTTSTDRPLPYTDWLFSYPKSKVPYISGVVGNSITTTCLNWSDEFTPVSGRPREVLLYISTLC